LSQLGATMNDLNLSKADRERALISVVNADADPAYITKLNTLLTSSDFKELSAEDKSAILSHLKEQPSQIDW
jgi:hypothetical protein